MKDKLIASERMKEFYKDIKHWVDYDYVVINDNLEICYNEVIEVIENIVSSKKKVSFDKQRIEKHVEKLIS